MFVWRIYLLRHLLLNPLVWQCHLLMSVFWVDVDDGYMTVLLVKWYAVCDIRVEKC